MIWKQESNLKERTKEKKIVPLIFLWTQNERERENAREKSEYVFSSICFYFYKLTPWPVTGITLRINKWSGLKQIKSRVKIYGGTVPTKKKNNGYRRMTHLKDILERRNNSLL